MHRAVPCCWALTRSPRDGHRGCVPRRAGPVQRRVECVEECVDVTVVCVAPMAHGTAVVYSTPDHLFDNDKHDELSYPPAHPFRFTGKPLVSQNALCRGR